MGKTITTVGVLSVIIALIAGIFGGNFYSDTGNKAIVTEKDAVIADLTEQLDNVEPTIVNETVYVDVANANLFLSDAMSDAWDIELSDNDGFLTCDGVTYDEDEVNLDKTKVKTWAYHWIDDDEYNVYFEAKYKFDGSDDDDSCTATRLVTVVYEDGEKPVVKFT